MTTAQKIEASEINGNVRVKKLEGAEGGLELCQNPWTPGCSNPDIELYIIHDGKKAPICRSCWVKIAETDLEW